LDMAGMSPVADYGSMNGDPRERRLSPRDLATV
jgi:hypothetical protein